MIIKPLPFDKSLFTVSNSLGRVNLFSLAMPMLLESILGILPGTVNTLVLSAYSETTVAAIGAANQIMVLITVLFMAISTGVTVVISNFIGGENPTDASKAAFAAVFTCLILSLAVTPVMYTLDTVILSLLNLTGDLLPEALDYYRVRMVFTVVPTVTAVILAVMRSYGHTGFAVAVGFVTNIINLLLTSLVVYLPEFSPVHGAEGAAWACVIGQTAGLALAIGGFMKLRLGFIHPEGIKELCKFCGRILRIGIPTALSSAAFTLSQTVTTSFVVLIGDVALSAKVYFSSILGYTYLISMNFGAANAILVGRLHGAGEPDRATALNRQLTRITVPVNLAVSLAVFLLRYRLVGMFTDSAVILGMSTAVFAIDIIAEVSRGVSQVYEYALRATGDVLFNVIFLTGSCWVFSIGMAYLLAIPCGLGLAGCYIGLAADELFRALLTFFRWKSGIWKRKTKS